MTARGRQRIGHTSPTHSSSGSPTSAAAAAAAQPQQQVAADKVQQQLDALGADHVGYGHKVLPGTNISIVGARPFSKVSCTDALLCLVVPQPAHHLLRCLPESCQQ
jgi:hypothetical protein